MASWYNNLLTKTSSQISSLRSSLAGDADGDTDDDTHVCRVLRGYYAEKGRPLPSWLPADPKAAAPVPQAVLVNPHTAARYGAGPPQQQQHPGAGGLSSLWDSGGNAAPAPAPQSLRAGRTPASLQPGGGGIERRPLPGQRTGSNQSSVSQYGRAEVASVPPAGAGGSAQDRLRQRLWGGSRTTSPSQQGNSQGPFAPPAGSGGSGGGSGGAGGGGSYEDRFAPGGMYDNPGGGVGGGSKGPVMSANSPWSTGGDEYSGGGGGGGGRPPRRQGLPSGPRGYR